MKRQLAALAVIVPLASCAQLTATPPGGGPSEAANIAACMAALVAGGIANPANIPVVAVSTPACMSLASTVVNDLIAKATGQATAARRAMRMAP